MGGWGSILKLIAQRIALGVLLLLAVSVLIFMGTEILPGDVASSILGQAATPQALENLRRELGLDPEIICVDTWLGAPNALMQTGTESQRAQFASLRMVNGYPMLYYTFLRNVVDAGLQDMITPLPQTSEGALRILNFHRVKADLVYLDASMEAGPLYRDLVYYWKLVRPGGHLIGDDYKRDTVRAGVEKFAWRFKLKVEPYGGKYRFVKKAAPAPAKV